MDKDYPPLVKFVSLNDRLVSTKLIDRLKSRDTSLTRKVTSIRVRIRLMILVVGWNWSLLGTISVGRKTKVIRLCCRKEVPNIKVVDWEFLDQNTTNNFSGKKLYKNMGILCYGLLLIKNRLFSTPEPKIYDNYYALQYRTRKETNLSSLSFLKITIISFLPIIASNSRISSKESLK